MLLLALPAPKASAQAITPDTNAAQPACWPSWIGGSGKGFVQGGNTVDGQWAGWWCELPGEPRGQWHRVGIISVYGYQIKHPDNILTKTPIELAQAYWELNVAQMTTAGSPPAQWLLREAWQQALEATKPAPPVPASWFVASAASGSRPLYSIVNGALVATTQRTPALASPATPCDCEASKLVVGPSTYCAPADKAPLVALCKAI
jgi:hypothetical protein